MVIIRPMTRPDRESVARITASIPVFDPEDLQLVGELMRVYLDTPGQKDYDFRVAAEGDSILGFVCFGPTPLTEGTFDLYWIAVDPGCFAQGIGTHLLLEAEAVMRSQRARLVLIETSSAGGYELTRRFYLKNGYTLAEKIRDFYRPGEDRVTFTKYL